MKKFAAVLLVTTTLLSGCGSVGRLKNVGKVPRMTEMGDPAAQWVEPSLGERGAARTGTGTGTGRGTGTSGQRVAEAPSASLFRAGSGELFRDQRAWRLGDIVTLRINIADDAKVANTTGHSRSGGESAGIAALLGLQNPLTKLLPGKPDPAKLIDTKSNSSFNGTGTTNRSENINMTVAAIVTQVLPNGNFVIRARQEVRVNYELRELIVTGIIRPQDIASDNSIRHSQIAEARVSYGGRGQISDVQQARWGQQIYDALFPF
jgi:flagellar L-ring protein FlgH